MSAFRRIPQRLSNDCAVAVVAMVAGVDYEVALSAFPPRQHRQGYPSVAVSAALCALTGRSWAAFGSRPFPPLGDPPILAPRAPCAVLVLAPRARTVGHWLAWDGGRLHNPSDDALTDYSAWRVVRVVVDATAPA